MIRASRGLRSLASIPASGVRVVRRSYGTEQMAEFQKWTNSLPAQRRKVLDTYFETQDEAFDFFYNSPNGVNTLRDLGKDTGPATFQPEHTLYGKLAVLAGNLFDDAWRADGEKGILRVEKEIGTLAWLLEKGEGGYVDKVMKGTMPEGLILTTEFLASPFFPLDYKQELLAVLQKRMNVTPVLISFIETLIKKNEMEQFTEVASYYSQIMRAYRKEVDVVVTTSAPLDQATLDFYKANIRMNYLTPDMNAIYATEVDPSILGGYRIKIGTNTHDHTWNDAMSSSMQKHMTPTYKKEADMQFLDGLIAEMKAAQ